MSENLKPTQRFFPEVKLYLGIGSTTNSAKEKLTAALVCTLGMLTLSLLAQQLSVRLDLPLNHFIAVSIGASAVLVFAAPHGALSQPWPVLGGQIISLFVGVLCQIFLPVDLLSASVAVGLSVLVMSALRCLHPPGGATALGVVLGGSTLEPLGIYYTLGPVLFSSLLILVLAYLLNRPFSWRVYPAHLYHRRNFSTEVSKAPRETELTYQDFISAVSQHETFIDVTEDMWSEILELAFVSSNKRHSNEHAAIKLPIDRKDSKLVCSSTSLPTMIKLTVVS
ncbi:HPP family protein [Reinekea sp.]|jgi:CBS domain-containing membrane protein|uniref:HPP family protein n=1 Tax=Reinekea sp. TaxID=1970455 RepID=UPI0039899F04